MDKIKVAVVDDHKILRSGLKVLLSEMANVDVVLEASNGKEFVDELQSITPDLVIIDINMPVMKGDEAVRIAKQHIPDLKVIVLSMNNDEESFQTMNHLGVDGYIIKESEYEELDRAIATVMKGGKYFSQELLVKLLNSKTNTPAVKLTDREMEILKYLCEGLSTGEIADKLLVSARTIEKHRSDMLLRTESTNSISLVVYAIRNGLVKI
jgi:DNA-binding NarL/FixJ family response regulator